MNLKSWGNYPKASGRKIMVSSDDEIKQALIKNTAIIAQGNHRSYGDSAFSDCVLDMQGRDCFLDFDTQNGVLDCQSGLLFEDILAVIIPKGWILPVLPGTEKITVGGAIASDVHGKNHHKVGTFSQFVKSLRIMSGNGEIFYCSANENAELFHATCGGMGLTGVILDAVIQLQPIQSNSIRQTTLKTRNLQHTFAAFEENNNSDYSVAWIDCLARGNEVGKGIFIVGEPSTEGSLHYCYRSPLKMPFYLPSMFLNLWTVKFFNWLYFHRTKEKTVIVSLQKFFFPLDKISHWNKIYGRQGFVQYQFVLPLVNSFEGISEILQKITVSRQSPFLAVLKRMGKSNKNFLSFPMKGFSLALDFKVNSKVLKLLDELDEIVMKYNGRIYLCKDARMSLKTFNHGYKQAATFRKFRKDHTLDGKLQSQQAQRLGL